MAICERRHRFSSSFGEEAHFIGYLVKEAPFDWVNVSPCITPVCPSTLY